MAATVDSRAAGDGLKDSMSLRKVACAASPLSLRIIAECPVTKARACDLILPHSAVITPVFMPVGTQGTMKGITVDQLDDLGCQICLGNTYHLGMRPVSIQMFQQTVNLSGFALITIQNSFLLQGPELIEKASGLHGFMNWKRNLLTVSETTP